jgi:hypothetical protein
MTSQLNYLIVQQRHSELSCRAGQIRLAQDARAARSTASPRSYIRRLLASRQLSAAGSPAAGSRPPDEKSSRRLRGGRAPA